ncbi:MAG: metal-dependent hydrolase [Pirellulales bacterium]|nr:metal-dependent hydrolase [Pirellulales bacterium]
MADFKTHITTSTIVGMAYGGVAYTQFGLPADQCVLAAGLCSVSGMLPDLDSDSGVPLRESLSFAAAVIPMLLIDRFRSWGMSADSMILATAGIYLFIRFVFGKALRAYTVHRGMFHSIPAVIIFAEVAFLLCGSDDLQRRLFLSSAVTVGVLTHLLLDEIYSVNLKRLRIKKSFGTAIKLFSKRLWPNISAYGKLAILTYLVIQDPIWGVEQNNAAMNGDLRAEDEQSGESGILGTPFGRDRDSGATLTTHGGADPAMAESSNTTTRRQ